MDNEFTRKGMFITFEGVDGCGKTTQLNKLAEYLKSKNYDTIITLEPGGSEIGKNLRQILLHHKGFVANGTELFLYLADRAQHTKEIVIENINKGKIVLCDRSIDSTVAYQGYARGYDIEKINLLNDIATDGYKPDLTLLFDIDVEVSNQRIGKNKDRLEKEGLDFQNKVRNGYLELAKKYPERIKIIDSGKPVEEVFDCVKKIIDEVIL